MSLQDRQAPIERRIVEALIAATPQDWDAIELMVAREDSGPEDESLAVRIHRPDTPGAFSAPTVELLEALSDLSDAFHDAGQPWREAIYQVRSDAGGDWRYEARFKY
jgi:hypothetical protein